MSGNGNNGSCNGGGSACPNWNLSQAKFGGAFEFDSSNDYIALPQSLLNGVSRGTISSWYNRHTFTGTTADNFPIFAYGGQDTDEYMIIYVDTDSGTFVFRKDAGLTNANFICPDKNFTNIWTNIFVTWDNSQMQCFINGVFTNSLSGDFEPGISQDTRLAGISNRVDYDFDGLLDEVAIWNRSLSSKEIHDMYNLNYRRYYWKANATDLAGNVNNTAIQEFNITLPPANANTTLRPVLPITNSSLNCSFTFIDPNPDDPGVGTIIFYNASLEHFRTNISIAPGNSNNTIVSYTLTANLTNNFTSTANWTCAARTNDLMINSEAWVNASVVINNSLPHNPQPFIFPATPFYNSSLNASSIIIDQDANDVVSVEIIWYNNSLEHFRVNLTDVANGTNQSYQLNFNATNNFTRGQNWTAAFRIYDGINLSSWVNASVVINNTLPHNPQPFIFPATPFYNSSLNASSLIIDQDANDVVSVEIIWYNNSAEHFRVNLTDVANGTNQSYTLEANATNNFTRGQNWTAAFRIYDGINLSSWVNASVVINNTLPHNPQPFIFPATPFYNSSLNASSLIIDQDANDVVSVEIIWYNNSAEHFRVNLTDVANGTNQSYTLEANATNNFTRGQNWTAAFRIYDGINLSSWVNASVVINNTLPHNPQPFIFPATPFYNSSLNASSLIIDQDANDVVSVEIIWYNNSAEHFRVNLTDVANGTNQSYTLEANATNNFTRGQNWTAAFRIYDGINLSSWVNASVVINNTL